MKPKEIYCFVLCNIGSDSFLINILIYWDCNEFSADYCLKSKSNVIDTDEEFGLGYFE